MHAKTQQPPGSDAELEPRADHGEDSYKGTGKLKDRVAIITGGDSGIGRAIAIAFAREGADIVVSYLEEHEDARETAHWVREAGRRCLMIPGDVGRVEHCREIVKKTIDEFDRLDILVNNAAFQMSHENVDELTEEEWVHTFNVNMHAQFFLAKAALPHLKKGASILNTTSVTSDKASPHLVAYAASKSAIATFTAAMGQLLAEKGIRVNCVAPGPIWTPLIPSTFPAEKVKEFGKNVPMKRPGQPKEVAPVYVFLASDDASYVTGALYPVTGGTPML
jgi:hypothetical protein